MMVRPARRIFRAISLGVFWREAPSTRLIIRSRKVSPGFEVMRTLISSERTRVPPVTAERSPPDSRMTGADSPVIADSSTEATPSMTSPSPGMNSQAATTTSPERSLELGSSSVVPSSRSLRASVSARALRKVSAWAFPRPSAMASAKLAKRTVNQSQRVICRPNRKLPVCWTMSATSTTRVMTAPTSTTNITGFLTIKRGSSFQKESIMALRRILRSPKEVPFACGFGVMGSSKCLSRIHQQVLQNRPEAEGGEKSQCADDDDHGNKKNGEERPGNREGAERFRDVLFCGEIAGDGKNGNHGEEAAEEHRGGESRVVPKSVGVDAAESGTVIPRSGSVGVENLRK